MFVGDWDIGGEIFDAVENVDCWLGEVMFGEVPK